MPKKESCGKCLPTTNRHTVNGVASNSPTGPHSHSQKTAATRIATGDTPVFLPYSQGSRTLLLKSSRAMNSPTVRMGANQPVEMAIDRPIGIAAAIHGPMYGINLNAAARSEEH